MRNAFSLLLALALVSPAFAQRDIGEVVVNADFQTTAITVTARPRTVADPESIARR